MIIPYPSDLDGRMSKDMLESLFGDSMVDELNRFFNQGYPVCGFLYSVLTNNLKQAAIDADDNNQRLLFHYVYYLYNFAPLRSWGSVSAVESWIDYHRCDK